MNECLVTKLKASVEDASLPVIGEMIFTRRSKTNAYFGLNVDDEIKVEILNDGYFYKDSTLTETIASKTKTVAAGNHAFYVTEGSVIRVTPRYCISRIAFETAELDLSQLTYMTSLKEIVSSGTYTTGSIEVLAPYRLTQISLHLTYYRIYGNLEVFEDLTELATFNVQRSHVIGDIAKCFGKSIKLTFLNIADSDITGSIESFVAAQIAAGRTTGTITFPYATACDVTYNGISLRKNTDITASDSNKLSWTSDGTITWA